MSMTPSLLKSIAKDSSMAFFFRLMAVPLGYGTNLALARLYGPDKMGTFFIAWNLVNIILVFCGLGLNSGFLRFAAALKAEGRAGDLKPSFLQGLGVLLLISLGAAACLCLKGDWLGHMFRAPNLPATLFFMALALPICATFSLFTEAVRGLGGVRWVIIQQNLLFPLVFLILVIGFFYASHQLVSQSMALGLAYLLSALASLVFFAVSPWSLLRQEESSGNPVHFKQVLKYSWPLYLNSGLLAISGSNVDNLILGFFISPEAVAYYGAAARMAPWINFPLLAINTVVPPLFVSLYSHGNIKGLEMVAQTTARWMYFLSLPLALILILLSPELLSLFGPDFTQARFALIVLCIAQLVNVASGSVGIILSMTGQQWYLILVQGAVGVGIIPLMSLAAWGFGFNGFALASALGIASVNVLLAWVVWRRLEVKAFAWGIRWANLACLLGLGLFFLSRPYVGPFWGAGFFAAGYLAMVLKTLKQEFNKIMQQPQYLKGTR